MDPKRARLPGELTFSLILVAFSLLALWQAYEISGFESLSGAGTFPLLATATMLGSGLVIALRTLRLGEEPDGEAGRAARFARQVTPQRIVVVTVMIAGYMLALQPLGFLPSTFLFLFASLLYLHRRGLLVSAALAAGSLLVIWLVFRKVFTVVLPSGSLWQGWVDWL